MHIYKALKQLCCSNIEEQQNWIQPSFHYRVIPEDKPASLELLNNLQHMQGQNGNPDDATRSGMV